MISIPSPDAAVMSLLGLVTFLMVSKRSTQCMPDEAWLTGRSTQLRRLSQARPLQKEFPLSSLSWLATVAQVLHTSARTSIRRFCVFTRCNVYMRERCGVGYNDACVQERPHSSSAI